MLRKKINCGFIAFVMLLSIFISPSLNAYADNNVTQTQIVNKNNVTEGFKDVGSNYSWAKDAIDYFQRQGIVTGNGDGTFKPGDNVTREQFAKLLVLTFHSTLVNNTDGTFYDVLPSRWSYQYIETVKDYLTGYYPPEGKPLFDPTAPSTREDIAVALVKMMGYTEDDLQDSNILEKTFTDADDIDPNISNLVAIASEKKLISGFTDHTFRPNDPVTRAQAVTLLFRAMKNSVKDYGTPLKLSVDVPQITNTSTVYITGTTEAGAKVTINDEDVNVDYNGDFKAVYDFNNEGQATFNIVAKKGTKKATLVKTIQYQISAPTLTVDDMPQTVNTNKITVSGTVKDNNGDYPTVTINGSETYVRYNGKFSREITLNEGQNTIIIKAQNDKGKNMQITKTITCNLNGPVINVIDCPETSNLNTVKISGTVKDSNDGNPELYINNKRVNVSHSGNWSSDVALKEGINQIIIKALNKLNKESTIVKNITLVLNGPAITITNCPDTVNTNSLKIQGIVKDSNDNNPKLYVNDKEEYVKYNGTWSSDISGLKEGDNTITIKSINSLGKTTIIQKKVTFTILGPDIDVNVPDTSNKNSIRISGKIKDNIDNYSDIALSVNGRTQDINRDGTWSTDVELNEGQNTITIVGTNSHGKQTKIEKLVTFTIAAPIINVNVPDATNYVNIKIKGTVTDLTDSQPTFTVNGEKIQTSLYTGAFEKDITLKEGVNAIIFVAVNKTGKQTSVTRNINLIILPPVLNATIPQTVNTDTIQISGNVSDLLDNSAVVTVNGAAVSVNTSGGWNYTINNLKQGDNNVKIVATNKYGKTTTIEKVIKYS